jgi:PleD family two-component response regulator
MNATQEHFLKILIADENITYRNALATQLRFQGYNVDFASGGFHLLHILEQQKDYLLVIIHENMLDMSAEEIISLVRISKKREDLPILFISKDSDEQEVRKMILNGASEYIVRPPTFKPVVALARKYSNISHNS